MSNLHLSKEMIDKFKKVSEPKNIQLEGCSIPVFESPLFPFEINYDACDVQTRLPIKVASGEWIHGVVIPEIESESPSVRFIDDNHKNNFRSFIERNWALEIFKF